MTAPDNQTLPQVHSVMYNIPSKSRMYTTLFCALMVLSDNLSLMKLMAQHLVLCCLMLKTGILLLYYFYCYLLSQTLVCRASSLVVNCHLLFLFIFPIGKLIRCPKRKWQKKSLHIAE